MQNSLERIFEGMGASLGEQVLPEVADPYARAQVAATIELLGNLATRVEWKATPIREEIERVRVVLATSSPRPAILDEPIPTDSPGLVRAREQHLGALAELQGSVGDAELRAFLAWQLECELALLRTGMYKVV